MSIAEYMLTDELVIGGLETRQGDDAELGEPLHNSLELPQDVMADADELRDPLTDSQDLTLYST